MRGVVTPQRQRPSSCTLTSWTSPPASSTYDTKLLTWFGSEGWSCLLSLFLYRGRNNLSPGCPTYRNACKRGGAVDVTTESGAQDKKKKGRPGQDLAKQSDPSQGQWCHRSVCQTQWFENEKKEKSKNANFNIWAFCWVWGEDERLLCVRWFFFSFLFSGKLGQTDTPFKCCILIKLNEEAKFDHFSCCPPAGRY